MGCKKSEVRILSSRPIWITTRKWILSSIFYNKKFSIVFRYGEFLQCSCLDCFTFGKLHGNTPYSAVLPECCRRNNHLNHQSGLSIPRPSYKSCLQDMYLPARVFPSLLGRGLAGQQLWKPCHNKSVHLICRSRFIDYFCYGNGNDFGYFNI